MIRSSLICAVATAATLMATTAMAEMLDNSELSLDPATQTVQIVEMIETVFEPLAAQVPGVVAQMISIADCESYGGRDGMIMHLDPSGELVYNPSPKSSAAGVLMVLLITHRPTYTQLGLDPTQVGDNIVFGRYLVEGRLQRGLEPFGDWGQCLM